MAPAIRDIKTLRENIKKELHGLYPAREIEAMTEILISHRLGIKRHEIGLKREFKLELNDMKWFSNVLEQIRDGCPLQYITGSTEFLGIPLKIVPGVLIPRPETEELVDWIITGLETEKPTILDIGTGSGCIALALKKKIPGSQVTGTDIDDTALALAAENAGKLQLDIRLLKHDVFSGQPVKGLSKPDIIVSNPPYVPESEKMNLDRNVSGFEPAHSLFVPDTDPLVFYRQIGLFSREHLNPGGWLYYEINENFAAQTTLLLEQQGFAEINVRRDINGKYRMIKCRKQ